MLKYSFVLPAYKACFFREALDSILNQTYKDFELIIVNDASPEGLDAIVKSYDDPRIRYYENENNIGGKDLVAQWNHCLEYARGEYIILASDDDVYHLEYLEKMDTLVYKYPEVNVFRPRVQLIDENGKPYAVDGFLEGKLSQLEYVYAWIKGYVGSGIPFFVFKKNALKDIGGFAQYPLAWFSDDATAIKLANNGICCTSDILFSFRQSGLNISTKKQTKQELLNKIKATEQFYNFIRTDILAVKYDEVSTLYQKTISWHLNEMMSEKIYSQMFNTSILTSLSITHRVSKLEFVSRKNLVIKWLNHINNKLI